MNQPEQNNQSNGFFSLPKRNSPEQIKKNSKTIGIIMIIEAIVLIAIGIAGILKVSGYL